MGVLAGVQETSSGGLESCWGLAGASVGAAFWYPTLSLANSRCLRAFLNLGGLFNLGLTFAAMRSPISEVIPDSASPTGFLEPLIHFKPSAKSTNAGRILACPGHGRILAISRLAHRGYDPSLGLVGSWRSGRTSRADRGHPNMRAIRLAFCNALVR